MYNQRVKYFQFGMLLLNTIIVVAICVFIYITINDIRGSYSARQFLVHVTNIPRQPLQNIVTCLMLLSLMAITFVLRQTSTFQNNLTFLYGSLIGDFIISFLIVYILDFNYNGIILYVFANVVSYIKNSKARYILLFSAIALFIVASHELVSLSIPLYSLQDFIGYYEYDMQRYLSGGYNVLISANIVLFVIYCVFVIYRQQGTINEVNQLYSELSIVNNKLEDANKQLREYAIVTEKMGEARERNRLAREIHDTLGHTLTGISAGLDACLTTLDFSKDDTRKQLELISRVTREGIVDIRRSVSKLRIDTLERFSLEQAIIKMINDMSAVTNANIYFVNNLKTLKFSKDEEAVIYRVIQESLTNAIRYSDADKIWIEFQKEDNNVLLNIIDNGAGCKDIVSGFGLRHIKERIDMIGGSVIIDGEDGFKVMCTIPIRWGENYD